MDGEMSETNAKPAKKARHPEGYKDEAEFLQTIRERFQEGVDFDRENRDAGLDDLKMFAGEQWDSEARLARANRPMITENVLPQYVAQVVGDIRINRPAIRVRPAEDADKELAEIREGLIRAIERDNDAQGVYAEAGTMQVACGIGHFRVTLKYADEATFDRDIGLENMPEPFSVVWDTMSTERTGRDAEWAFVVDEMPRKAFKKAYKDAQDTTLEVPQGDVDGWSTRDTVRVTEYWEMYDKPTEIALLEDGVVVPLDELPEGAVPLQTRKTSKRCARMWLTNGYTLLSGPHEMPIDRIPIIRVRGWEVAVGSKRKRWGLVRFARDLQRLRNYWRSTQAESLALAPKDKWLFHETAEGSADDFRDAVDNDDNTLVWRGQVKPERLPPPQVNSAVMQEIAQLTQSMKDVTGIHDASLGIKSNETSGKAILARQREGDVATYIYHDNLQAAIREGGRLINQLIPVVFDTPRTIRVIGEDETTNIKRVNDPNDPKSIDINQGRYDIVVDTGPSYSTKRVEAAESMMAFVQAVPAAAAVSGDLIAQAQDWPMSEEIAERLKKTLPPQITAKADEDMSPEEMQAKQQAAQQAQQQAQMQAEAQAMAKRKAEAEVKEAEAKANKANADAIKALTEAHQQPPAQIIEALFGPGAFDAYRQAMQGYQDSQVAQQLGEDRPGPQGAPGAPQAPPQPMQSQAPQMGPPGL